MARTLAVPYKRFEGMRISPKDIQADEDRNGRAFEYTQADILDLLADLRAGIGIEQPVKISPLKLEDGTQGVKLEVGFRRWVAATEYLKENPDYLLPCIMVEPESEREALEMNARENAKRKTLSIIDQGHIAKRLQELPTKTGGNTLEQIGEVLGCSGSQVGQAIKLVNELPLRLQKLVHTRELSAQDAFGLLKIPVDAREAAVERVIEETGKAIQTEAPQVDGESGPVQKTPRESKSATVRKIAEEAGAKLKRKMAEVRKYLQIAVDEDGPGSNKGEVALKGALLDFLDGELTEKQMDNRFGTNCKVKV